jgi:ketosteroid isomerase-like protein
VVTIIVPPDADLAATERRDNLFVLSAAMAAEVARRVSGPLVALVPLLATGVAHAQSLGPDEQRQIRAVIESQIDAFRNDDGERAFSFASPDIRAMFGDAATFMGMVRGGYAAVYRPREVEFRSLELQGAQWSQRVLVVGPDNVPVIARYIMEQQSDGSWRIDGCVLEPAPDMVT